MQRAKRLHKTFQSPFKILILAKSSFSTSQFEGIATKNSAMRIKRFYKKVDIVPHPVMSLLQSEDLTNANFQVPHGTEIGYNNLSMIRES